MYAPAANSNKAWYPNTKAEYSSAPPAIAPSKFDPKAESAGLFAFVSLKDLLKIKLAKKIGKKAIMLAIK